jgi:secreted Zn-dependent insulinase-like peptidase
MLVYKTQMDMCANMHIYLHDKQMISQLKNKLGQGYIVFILIEITDTCLWIITSMSYHYSLNKTLSLSLFVLEDWFDFGLSLV